MVVLWNIKRSINWTMASNSFKLILLCVLVSSFNVATTKAQDPTFIYQNCTGNKTNANSTYQMDLRTLLSSLSSNAVAKTFYNYTVAGRTPSDTVYGMFMCRGDVPLKLCRQCVLIATDKLSSDSECSLSKQGVIWYNECMVRYSSISFFSTVAIRPRVGLLNTANVSDQANFMRFLFDTMNKTADEAANFPIGIKKYATKQANLSEFRTLYCLAQCTQDLSPEDCRWCLSNTIGDLPWCCQGKQGGRVLYPSCNIRYELYPFYRVTDETPAGLVPETKYPETDSEYSDDPGYISHNCSSNVATDTAFQSNLRTLLSDLSSNATSGDKFKMQVGTVHGLFTCRGDLSRPLCGQCIQNATEKIGYECRSSEEAIIWYNHCWLRYSIRSFTMETSPRFRKLNLTDTNPLQNSFTFKLSTKLAEMANETGDSGDRYVTGTLRFNDFQTLYILAQCTQDLSSNDCGICLKDVIGSAIPWSRLGSVGGRVLSPSCSLRFELFQFYNLTPAPAATPPSAI